MSSTLNLALVITGDAASAKKALADTKGELAAVAAANDQVAASTGRARDAQGRFIASAKEAGDAIKKAGDGLKKLADDGEKAGAGAAKGVGLARHEVSNLSAQLADLGVQIAGGGSPFMAMIQQGPQIADILGGRGLTGIIAGVGQGFLSLINPVTLTLAAITAAGYAASALYTAIVGEGGAANKTIEEQNELIAAGAKAWGDSLPGIKAYNDELERQANIKAGKEAGEASLDQIYQPARDAFADFQVEYSSVLTRAEQLLAPDAIARIKAAYGEAGASLDNYTTSLEKGEALQTALARAAEYTNSKPLADLASEAGKLASVLGEVHDRAGPIQSDMRTLGDEAGKTAEQIAAANEQLERIKRNRTRQVPDFPTSKEDRDAASDQRFADRSAATLLGAGIRPNFEDVLAEREAAQQKADRTEQRADNRAEAALQRQQDRIDLLRAEIQAIGLSDDARAKLIGDIQGEIDARNAGIDAQSAEAQAYRDNAAEIVRLSQERAAGVKSARDAEKEWSEDRDLAKGVLSDITGALRSGTKGWEDWAAAGERALDRVLDRILDAGVDGLLDTFMPKPRGAATSGPAASPANDNIATQAANTAAKVAVQAMGGSAGSFATVGNYRSGVDARLTDVLQEAASRAGVRVEAFSGFRAGDTRFHGQGLATDVRLFDAAGKAIPNYQNAAGFRTYEQFAQQAYGVAQERGLGEDLRWGGYFSGGRGRYGAVDTMHFDLAGRRVGMGGGSWEGGLNASQRALWPGAESIGLSTNKAVVQLDKLTASTTANAAATTEATSGLNAFGGGLGKMGSALSQFPAAPAAATGGGGAGLSGDFFSRLFGNWATTAPAGGVTAGGVGLWADGGFTGPGGVNEFAGYVHKGEVVYSQADVARHGGVQAVEAHRLGLPGYANGGVVESMGSVVPFPGSSRGGAAGTQGGSGARPRIALTINNAPPGYYPEVQEEDDEQGGQLVNVTFAKMWASESRRPGSPVNKALRERGSAVARPMR